MRAASLRPEHAETVGIIEHDETPVFLGDFGELRQPRLGVLHRLLHGLGIPGERRDRPGARGRLRHRALAPREDVADRVDAHALLLTGDLIDLSGYLADAADEGVWIGTARPTNSDDLQVGYRVEGGATIVQFYAPSDGNSGNRSPRPTGEIELLGRIDLAEGDFIF